MKKAILKRTADILEKLGIAGIAVGFFQNGEGTTGWGIFFLAVSYIFTLWEARK